ncbi:hypothetical protein COO60DRAFT_505648 [Scenedesmus sp. NREL 46B-D3]|nr:hypothetical protein COO60DRAFT_505648 [Scenedesmus sp. NREL 46B-D3]
MALIPQVPVLFTGSIRENLAPIGGHCDAALWSALRRAHLAPVVAGSVRGWAAWTTSWARGARRCLRARSSCWRWRVRCSTLPRFWC